MSPSNPSRRVEPQRVYQLRLELLFIEPVVWRTILVPETLTLPKLDPVIQAAMGWANSHLHAWRIDGRRYGRSRPRVGHTQRTARRAQVHRRQRTG